MYGTQATSRSFVQQSRRASLVCEKWKSVEPVGFEQSLCRYVEDDGYNDDAENEQKSQLQLAETSS